MSYYSQDGQDQYLIEELFKTKTTGVFVDIGANDGISLSNTKALEELGWTGLCIEPLPNSFKKLKLNRNCITHNVAISNTNENLKFLEIEGYSEMLSGLLKNYNELHLQRIQREIQNYGVQ